MPNTKELLDLLKEDIDILNADIESDEKRNAFKLKIQDYPRNKNRGDHSIGAELRAQCSKLRLTLLNGLPGDVTSNITILRDDISYIQGEDPDPSKSEFYKKVLAELDGIETETTPNKLSRPSG